MAVARYGVVIGPEPATLHPRYRPAATVLSCSIVNLCSMMKDAFEGERLRSPRFSRGGTLRFAWRLDYGRTIGAAIMAWRRDSAHGLGTGRCLCCWIRRVLRTHGILDSCDHGRHSGTTARAARGPESDILAAPSHKRLANGEAGQRRRHKCLTG
jgi:hypothetical protein